MKKTFLAFAIGLATVINTPALADPAPDFTILVEKAMPAVVNIEVSKAVSGHRLGRRERMPDLFEEFFGSPFGRMPENFGMAPEEGMPHYEGSGSGFFIDESGEILTNAHVVDGADSVIVRLNDRQEYQAKVIGIDKRSDIALLKIEAEQAVPVAVLGDSNAVKVGDWVLAIGSPFGFDATATKGIVSALGRNLPSGAYTPFIQTDAAINPGNSGGPLFNSKGEVIGINSQIYSRSGTFNGLGFAIPINVAKNIAQQLKAEGKVSRGWLGVMIQEVDQQLAQSFGLDKPQGALIAKVLPDSPAEAAGLQAGDVILQFNGRNIVRSGDLPSLVAMTNIGETAALEILREGKREKIEFEVGNIDNADMDSISGENKSIENWGMSLKTLDEESREALAFEGEGVLVAEVKPRSAAAKSGLRAGDILLAVGRTPVSSVNAAAKLFAQHGEKSQPIPVLIHRRGQTTFLALVPEKSKR